jgi:DNA primase
MTISSFGPNHDQFIAQVRSATDIVAIMNEHTTLKLVGRRWVGLCPFHSQEVPSLSVNREEGFYYCFECHASGDVLTFIGEIESLSFTDTIRFLADRAGLHPDA